MNRSNPPCNTCVHVNCRNCSWLSPLDASYRTLLLQHSVLALFAISTRRPEPPTPKPSLIHSARQHVARFLAEFLPRSR